MTAPRTSTPQYVIDCGLPPIPIRGKAPTRKNWQIATFHPDDWEHDEDTGFRCGQLADGTYVYVWDYDNKPEQGISAAEYFNTTLAKLPIGLREDLVLALSTSHKGRYIIARSRRALPRGTLYNQQGQRIGDFLGIGAQVVAPTPDRMLQKTLADIPLLSDANFDMLCAASGYTPKDPRDLHSDNFDRQAVEHWLGNINQLLDANGIPRRFTAKAQARHVLTGELNPPSTSDARAFVCRGLILHGYPDEEAAALLIHLCDYGASQRKGSRWLYEDITRLIEKERAHYPNIRPSPSRVQPNKPAQPLPQVEPLRRGRPRVMTTDELYEGYTRLADCGRILMNREERAKFFGISIPTLDRLDHQLRERGLIACHTVRKGRQTYSYIAILSAIKNTQTAQPEAAQPANFDSTKQAIATPQNDDPDVLKKEHTSLIGPQSAPRPPLSQAVNAMRLAGARNRKQLKRMLAEYFPGHEWRDKAIDIVYDRLCKEARFAREREKIRTAEPDELRRWAKSWARSHAKAHEQGNTKLAYVWGIKEKLLQDEIERRKQGGAWLPERRKTGKRRSTPLLFDVTPVDLPQSDPPGRASAEVCSTAPPQAAHRPPRVNFDTAWFDLQRFNAELAEQDGDMQRADWFRSLIPSGQGVQP